MGIMTKLRLDTIDKENNFGTIFDSSAVGTLNLMNKKGSNFPNLHAKKMSQKTNKFAIREIDQMRGKIMIDSPKL